MATTPHCTATLPPANWSVWRPEPSALVWRAQLVVRGVSVYPLFTFYSTRELVAHVAGCDSRYAVEILNQRTPALAAILARQLAEAGIVSYSWVVPFR